MKFVQYRCCQNSPSLKDHLYVSCEQVFGVVVQILMDYSSLFPLLSYGLGSNDDDNYAHGDNDVLGGGYDYDIEGDEYDDLGSDNALI